MRFEVEAEAIEYVLSLGSGIEVLEPAVLREKVADQARGLVQIYDVGCNAAPATTGV